MTARPAPASLPALVLLMLLVLVPPAAAAEEAEGGNAQDPHAGDLFVDEFNALDLFKQILELRPRLRLVHDLVIDERFPSAEVDSFDLEFQAAVPIPITRSFAIRLTGKVESTVFDFAGDRRFVDAGRGSGDPWDDLFSNEFSLEGRYTLFENWAIVGGLGFDSSWERGSRYARGIDLDGFAGVAHIFADTVSVVVALRVGGEPGHSPSWTPLVRIGWRITDDIELQTRGLGLGLAARVDENVTLFLSAERESDSWRLGDRGGTLGRGELRRRRIPILCGARWKITQQWRVLGQLGAIVGSRYTVRDRDGDFFDSEGGRGAAFTGNFYLEYRF